MNNKIGNIITGSMIALSSMTGCKEAVKKTNLNELMANKPIKEYLTIKSSWRKGIAEKADKQHSLDSVAFSNLVHGSYLAKDSNKVKEFNNIAKRTKLKNDKSYTEAYNEFDNKMIEAGITTKDFENHQKELKMSPNIAHKQFKLDSLEYDKYFKNTNKTIYNEFKEITKRTKP